MMHDCEKSDPAIVAVKLTNKAGRPAAESVEPRAGAEGNVNQQSTGRAQYRETVQASSKSGHVRFSNRHLCRRKRRSIQSIGGTATGRSRVDGVAAGVIQAPKTGASNHALPTQ
jgi:hypothetical protein